MTYEDDKPHLLVFQQLILQRQPSELERYARALCVQLAGDTIAFRIKNINLSEYSSAIRSLLSDGIKLMHRYPAGKALYCEFDSTNNWCTSAFVTTRYVKLSNSGFPTFEEWPSRWVECIDGPEQAALSAVYEPFDYPGTPEGHGVFLYVIARALTVFVDAVIALQPLVPYAICAAHHDAEVHRLYEPAEC